MTDESQPTAGDSATATSAPPAPTGESRTFQCEGCGADLEFHIGEQSLKCPFCGFVKQLIADEGSSVSEQDFEAMLARLAEHRDKDRRDEQGFSEVSCSACSATVRFSGTLTSSECAYCGSPLQLAEVHDAPHRVPVDGVLPFQVERAVARKNLAAWVRSRWFAPNAFRKRGIEGKFSGIYLPYWTFDSLTATRYTGQRGRHYYVTVGSGKNRRRVQRTSWTPVSGAFQRFFDDVMIVAASDLPRKRVRALEPWPLAKCVPFNQELLAGFLARTYDVELPQGFTEGKKRIDEAIATEVRQRIGGDAQRVQSIHSTYGALTYKHLLLPLWMMAYRFGKKSYQILVNASTGEVQGERPYSWIKITLASLATLAAIAITALVTR